MARKNVEFNSNTMKEEHRIGNTDLYYFQIYNGVNKNGYDSYIDYLEDKHQETYGDNREIAIDLRKLAFNRAEFDAMVSNGETTYTSYEEYLQDALILMQRQRRKDSKKSHRTVRNNAWVIYKKDPNLSYEDFIAKISGGELKRVGDLLFSPLNVSMEPDVNGNLILKTIGSDLENRNNVGDVLISSDGEVLANSRGSYGIRPANKYGYYPIDVFRREEDPVTGDSRTVEIRKNFMDSFGKLIGKTSYQKTASRDEQVMYPITRTFRSTEDKIVKDIYPTSYVHCYKDGVDYYPSAAALLIANKKAIASGQPAIIGESFAESLESEIDSRMGVVRGLVDDLLDKIRRGDRTCIRGNKILIDELEIMSDYEKHWKNKVSTDEPQGK